jgi:hypothetical protein
LLLFPETVMAGSLLHEREVWDAAIFLVSKHGDDAPELARVRAGQLEEKDAVAARIWRFIADAAEEIVRSAPAQHEHVH